MQGKQNIYLLSINGYYLKIKHYPLHTHTYPYPKQIRWIKEINEMKQVLTAVFGHNDLPFILLYLSKENKKLNARSDHFIIT